MIKKIRDSSCGLNSDHQIGPKVSLIEFVGGTRITQRSRARHVGLCIQSTELLLSACTSIILSLHRRAFPGAASRCAESSSRLQARPSDLARPHRHVRRRFRSIPPIILRAVQVQLAIEEKHLPQQQSPVSQHWGWGVCTSAHGMISPVQGLPPPSSKRDLQLSPLPVTTGATVHFRGKLRGNLTP